MTAPEHSFALDWFFPPPTLIHLRFCSLHGMGCLGFFSGRARALDSAASQVEFVSAATSLQRRSATGLDTARARRARAVDARSERAKTRSWRIGRLRHSLRPHKLFI